jgi:hypothetical protein
MPRTHAIAAALGGSALVVSAAARAPADFDVSALLARVTARVEEYYARAQSIICLETVQVQALKPDLLAEGFPRRLEYELRIAWDEPDEPDALPEAQVLRRLLRVGGRPPDPDDDDGCMDPKAVSPEPLSMLLPGNRDDFTFTLAGTGRTDGRDAIRIDYRSMEKGEAQVTWKGDCVGIALPGRSAGHIWIDAETYDVLRLDEHLVGQFDYKVPREHSHLGSASYMVIERSDMTIRYAPVSFDDPPETLLLPKSIESLQIVRGAGVPRARIVQTFSGYRRFLTDAHILTTPQ